MAFSTKTTYQGKVVNAGTKAILVAANKMLATEKFGGETSPLTLVQGSYSGGVAASAGTHNGGGAIDITAYNYKNRVKVFRLLGVAMWYRPTIRGLWSAHLHGIVCGDASASSGAKAQVTEYYNKQDGLAGSGRDLDWRPYRTPILFKYQGSLATRYAKKTDVFRTQPYGAASASTQFTKGQAVKPVAVVRNAYGNYWFVLANGKWGAESDFTTTKPVTTPPATTTASIRPLTYNIPDAKKLTNATEATRANDGVALVKTGKPDVIGFQELVGPGEDSATNDPSAFAAKIKAELGSGYTFIVPTTTWNENYAAINNTTTTLVKKYGDKKLYSGDAPGKHCTRVVLKDKRSGKVYVVGVMHLGSIKDTSEAERQGQGKAAMEGLKEVSALHNNAPIIAMGDMNTPNDIKAFVDGGLLNLRRTARETNNKDYATHVTISDTTPNVDTLKIIDHIYVPAGWIDNGYNVLLGAVNGKFILPRPSDHVPVLGSVTPN